MVWEQSLIPKEALIASFIPERQKRTRFRQIACKIWHDYYQLLPDLRRFCV
jgi:hypothetical protein